MKVLQGSMREVRYQVCKETNKLTECETDMYHVGQVAYIDGTALPRAAPPGACGAC